MQFIDKQSAEVASEHLRILKEIEALPEGEPTPLPTGQGLWGLRLPESLAGAGRQGAWMLGAVQGLELGKGVEIGHWSPSGFVSFGQFSLNKPGARPVFVAFGRGAEVALRGMKSAAESYRPEAFDEDGYLRHAPGVGQATE